MTERKKPRVIPQDSQLATSQIKERTDFESRKFQLEIGGQTRDQIEGSLSRERMIVSGYTWPLWDSCDFTQSKQSLDLVRVTPKELGFVNFSKMDKIQRKAIGLGLKLCPPEVGPYLRLAYKDQPPYKSLTIAMKPVVDDRGEPIVFVLDHWNDGLHLNEAGLTNKPDDELVFRL